MRRSNSTCKNESRKWTRKEYERLAELGVFRPEEKLELLDGEIYEMTSQGPQHPAATEMAAEALRKAFGPGFYVRLRAPIVPDEYSEPEPDIVVLPGNPDDYWREHPTDPLLVVEVANTSLRHDTRTKGSLYARAGLPEYWVVNLPDRLLEVFRMARRDPDARYGWSYESHQRLGRTDSVQPLACPGGPVQVEDLFVWD